VSPHITAPEENAFWPQGSRQLVRWDTDKVPRDSVVATGMVVLGYWSPESDGEHLDYGKFQLASSSQTRMDDERRCPHRTPVGIWFLARRW
jgi:hypothetical protein